MLDAEDPLDGKPVTLGSGEALGRAVDLVTQRNPFERDSSTPVGKDQALDHPYRETGGPPSVTRRAAAAAAKSSRTHPPKGAGSSFRGGGPRQQQRAASG